ncbi:MAG: SPASM domain-containing protein [Bacteroidales bacterium]|nr:SPASM domain-containing protein [Bacteroidales bacterium]
MNTELKVSRYTFLIQKEGKYYIYNTLSNALLEIDGELFQFINDYKKNRQCFDSPIEKDIKDFLKKGKFITENDEDEFLCYKSAIMAMRQGRKSLGLTIAPTMDCCFNCHYCFEKSKRPAYMSEDVMRGIVKYIGDFGSIKTLYLTWFGGEPLMAVPEMEKLYKKLRRKLKGVVFHSNIITTGFHLTENSIKALQHMKVTNMQITLDGLKDTHNKIKFTKECDDVFTTVLNNIDKACELAPEIHIVIRTNLTKSNAHEYNELQQMIRTRFAGKNVVITPAFVMDRDKCGHSLSRNLFSVKEYPKYILELAKKGIDSPQVRYPNLFFIECAIRNDYSVSFDPEGNMYKCWEHIGERKYALGKINKNGVVVNINKTLLNRQMFGADPLEDPTCRKCSYLPICGGGCPMQRIENVFNNGKNVNCTYYKGHIENFILEHIRRKELMEKIKNNK